MLLDNLHIHLRLLALSPPFFETRCRIKLGKSLRRGLVRNHDVTFASEAFNANGRSEEIEGARMWVCDQIEGEELNDWWERDCSLFFCHFSPSKTCSRCGHKSDQTMYLSRLSSPSKYLWRFMCFSSQKWTSWSQFQDNSFNWKMRQRVLLSNLISMILWSDMNNTLAALSPCNEC